MVKPEHRQEYNRRLAEEASRKRWLSYFVRSTRVQFLLWVLFGLLILVPLSLIAIEPDIINPDYVCRLRANVVVTRSVSGFEILVDTRDSAIYKTLQHDEKMYHYTSPIMQQLLRPGDTAIDVGAGFGYHALVMGDRVGAMGHVYALEPRHDVRVLLEATSVLNAMPQLHVKEAVAYSTNTNILLELDAKNLQTSKIAAVGNLLGDTDHELRVVKAHKLDDILKGVQNVKLMHINAGGAGLAVLEGASNIISTSPNLSIIMDWNVEKMKLYGDISSIIDDLTELDFEFWAIDYNSHLKLLTKTAIVHYTGDLLITRDYID